MPLLSSDTDDLRAVHAIGTWLGRRGGRLRAQEGITLVMAIGILGVLSLTGTTLIYYSSTTMRSGAYSGNNSNAYSLAEAGLNEMMAVLSRPENNALNKYLLGYQPDGTVVKTTSAYNGGTVTWWGILNEGTATWSVTSIGETKNPTGPTASPIRRTLTAKVPVTPTVTQPLNSPAWNYIYATRTGNACDLTLSQSVQVGSPLYVNGNLCLQNTASITNGPLVVRGQLTLSQSANAVGSLLAPINEAHIASGCQWKNNLLHLLCSPLDNVYARVLDASPTQIAAPAVDWDGWYRNASPGPYFPCYAQSGTPPAFDNDQGRRRASSPGTRPPVYSPCAGRSSSTGARRCKTEPSTPIAARARSISPARSWSRTRSSAPISLPAGRAATRTAGTPTRPCSSSLPTARAASRYRPATRSSSSPPPSRAPSMARTPSRSTPPRRRSGRSSAAPST